MDTNKQYIIDMYITGLETGNADLVQIALDLAGDDLELDRIFSEIEAEFMQECANPTEIDFNKIYDAVLNLRLNHD